MVLAKDHQPSATRQRKHNGIPWDCYVFLLWGHLHCQWLGLGIPGIQHSKSVPECHGPARNVAPNSPRNAPDVAGKRTVSWCFLQVFPKINPAMREKWWSDLSRLSRDVQGSSRCFWNFKCKSILPGLRLLLNQLENLETNPSPLIYSTPNRTFTLYITVHPSSS